MKTRGLLLGLSSMLWATACAAHLPPWSEQVRSAFKNHSIFVEDSKLDDVTEQVQSVQEARCYHSPTGNNSKVKFAAVEIASLLGLNPKVDSSLTERISAAISELPCDSPQRCYPESRCIRPIPSLGWDNYFGQTLALSHDGDFLALLQEKKFFPVHISWEDIGRYENSVWGDRISDVGIWVRRNEQDPASAELALSVRRDSNFRDKVLVVPSEKIKIHTKGFWGTREVTLPERLQELGLASKGKDRHVIVSNQFAIVPVPSRDMDVRTIRGEAPRVAFNFSIFPYGSTNYVITDVIEGSSEAIVGPGNHQLLYANISGEKAPFTASRAAERPDLLKLESELRSRGMDVDVQRYYLIQIPLRKDRDIELSNMGTPPFRFAFQEALSAEAEYQKSYDAAPKEKDGSATIGGFRRRSGLDKVAIGHGEVEGPYHAGSGFRGARAEEPIRVTVVYFVTPVGKVTRHDMDTFSKAFEEWDAGAIWGGSFVTKE